jgi:phosphoribosylglycinamide formyltransferase 1
MTSAGHHPGAGHPARLAVLVSGAGTIMQAIIEAGVPIELVLADRPCRALERAAAARLPTALVDRAPFGWPAASWDRPGFTAAVEAELRSHDITLIAMSGFLTVFSPGIFEHFKHRILNTHPSLLPAFKGAGPQVMIDTLASGVTETGCTIHLADAELDAGQILAQERVPVLPDDTPATLQERIKTVERRLYPHVIRELLAAQQS